MTTRRIFALASPYFRRRRMRQFVERLRPTRKESLLDVGGDFSYWIERSPLVQKLDVLNIVPGVFDGSKWPEHRISYVVGNGCRLEFADGSYDIAFSNSVIEHVGGWGDQQAFAREIRRVGKKVWVQTPAREFFFEPHFMGFFVHWFSPAIRRKLVRYFTLWGWLEKPDQARIESVVQEIRLLSFGEVRELFPDCEIYRERFLGIFTKSYIAFRA